MQHQNVVVVLLLFLTENVYSYTDIKIDLSSNNNTKTNSSGKGYEPMSNEIIVQLNPGATESELKKLLVENYEGFELQKKVNIAGNDVYLVTTNASINVDLGSEKLEQLDKEKQVKSCQLQIKYNRSISVQYIEEHSDYRWNGSGRSDFNLSEIASDVLWNLNGKRKPSQGITEAWEMGITGKGPIVAAVDQYLQHNHPDLLYNVREKLGWNFVDNRRDTTPPVASAYHGTAVTGVMIAQPRNYKCTVGVAYDSTTIGIVIIPEEGYFTITDLELARWWNFGNSYTSIYCNSWGPGPAGYSAGGFTLTSQVLEKASKEGRDGKGAMYVMAAGNNGESDNCNADFLKNRIEMIVAQSVTPNGPAGYAQAGSSIMCSAYGGDYTNFRREDLILALNPYSRCSILVAGTSFAAPTVVGAIALALEANPHLTWRCIHHLLVRTSKRHNLRDPLKDFYWQKNGAGYYTHCRMGYGLIDAGDLVRQAKRWKKVPEQEQCTVDKQVSISTSNKKVNYDTLTIYHGSDKPCRKVNYLEYVLVNITYYYSAYRGSVVLNLISPSGTKSCIMTHRPYDSLYFSSNGTLQWVYKSLQFWGENPEGQWKLEFSSVDPDVTVKLLHWGLKLYGTTKPPQPYKGHYKNKKYYYDKHYEYGEKRRSRYDGHRRSRYDGHHNSEYDEKNRSNYDQKRKPHYDERRKSHHEERKSHYEERRKSHYEKRSKPHYEERSKPHYDDKHRRHYDDGNHKPYYKPKSKPYYEPKPKH